MRVQSAVFWFWKLHDNYFLKVLVWKSWQWTFSQQHARVTYLHKIHVCRCNSLVQILINLQVKDNKFRNFIWKQVEPSTFKRFGNFFNFFFASKNMPASLTSIKSGASLRKHSIGKLPMQYPSNVNKTRYCSCLFYTDYVPLSASILRT